MQPIVQLAAGGALPARQAEHPVEAAVQLDHLPRAGRLMQTVHVLRDDAGQQAAPLQVGDRAVPGVGGGPRHVRHRRGCGPSTLPRRRAAHGAW